MGEIKFITGLVMVALFAIAITTYVISFASDNDTPIDLGDETVFTSVQEDLQDNTTKFLKEDIDNSSASFFPSEISPGDEVMNSGNAFKVGLGSLLAAMYSITVLTRTYLFGGSNAFNIVLTAVTSLFLFIGIRYIYKSWVGKNPD